MKILIKSIEETGFSLLGAVTYYVLPTIGPFL